MRLGRLLLLIGGLLLRVFRLVEELRGLLLVLVDLVVRGLLLLAPGCLARRAALLGRRRRRPLLALRLLSRRAGAGCCRSRSLMEMRTAWLLSIAA
jgi:hypothetical protein